MSGFRIRLSGALSGPDKRSVLRVSDVRLYLARGFLLGPSPDSPGARVRQPSSRLLHAPGGYCVVKRIPYLLRWARNRICGVRIMAPRQPPAQPPAPVPRSHLEEA